MAPAQTTVFLFQKPSTENGKFRVVVLRLAWVAWLSTRLLLGHARVGHALQPVLRHALLALYLAVVLRVWRAPARPVAVGSVGQKAGRGTVGQLVLGKA